MLGFFFFALVSVANAFVWWHERSQDEAEYRAKRRVHVAIALVTFFLLWWSGSSFMLAFGVSILLPTLFALRDCFILFDSLSKSGDLEAIAIVQWDSLLPALAEQARSEPWGEEYWVLRYKILETFRWHVLRIRGEEWWQVLLFYVKLLPVAKTFTFNIGLTTPDGRELSLSLRRNIVNRAFWRIDAYSIIANTAGNYSTSDFQWPTLWPILATPQEIFAGLNIELIVPDLENLLETLHNLPLHTLRMLCQEDPIVLDCCERILRSFPPSLRSFPPREMTTSVYAMVKQRRIDFTPLRESFAASRICRRALERFMAIALTHLQERVRRDYSTLYPTRSTPAGIVTLEPLSFLGPLSHVFSGRESPEGIVALRLHNTQLEAYAFISPEMAYAQARLFAPSITWLADWWHVHFPESHLRH
mgnify:CR=1 FL=1